MYAAPVPRGWSFYLLLVAPIIMVLVAVAVLVWGVWMVRRSRRRSRSVDRQYPS